MKKLSRHLFYNEKIDSLFEKKGLNCFADQNCCVFLSIPTVTYCKSSTQKEMSSQSVKKNWMLKKKCC